MIAIIPARGGSKGLPQKNIKLLNNKPLIAYTIEAALKSKSIDRVFVTTDDKSIADIAIQYGAEVPFLRPHYLASDEASAIDVYLYFCEKLYEVYDMSCDKFVVLLPTCPLRTEKHIDEAMDLFYKQGATTLISVCEAEVPPSWYFKMDTKGIIENCMFSKGSVLKNRQCNEKYIIPNGSIYILDYELLKLKKTYYCENTIAYIMRKDESVDIDNEYDFKVASYIMNV
ncbi:MAG: acylneuraminate cytidylyltransferase family protein [Clostridium sp.]